MILALQIQHSLTEKTSMAWRKSCGISDRSHWFQGLSLSTSSREEGMSKSPGEKKIVSVNHEQKSKQAFK